MNPDRSDTDFSDETVSMLNFSVESYDKKNCLKLPKSLRCRKAHSFQSIKGINAKF